MAHSIGTDPGRPGQLLPGVDSWWFGSSQPVTSVTARTRPLPTSNRPGRRLAVFGEVLLACVLSSAVAAVMGWRVLRAAGSAVPGQDEAPFGEVWALAWSGHAVRPGSGVGLGQVFDANAFYPARHSLTFADSMLGYGPLTWFFHGANGPVNAYDLIFVSAAALSALGAYLLARQLGAHPVGALVAGAGFAYPPWHQGQLGHLNVLSTGPMVIALAMLARGHGLTMSAGRTGGRPLWAVLGWVLAAWQLTIGFAVGLPFAYLMAAIGVLVLVIGPVRLLRLRRSERRGRLELSDRDGVGWAAGSAGAALPAGSGRRTGRLLLADLAGGALFALTAALLAPPYLRLARIDSGVAEGLRSVAGNSPHPAGLLSPPVITGTWAWLTAGDPLPAAANELRLLPGAILLGLGLLGLFVSAWRWWWRALLGLLALAFAGLSLGTRSPRLRGLEPPFLLLWRHLPGWQLDRSPGRLMVFVTLALALLAAGGVTRLTGGRMGEFRSAASGMRWAGLLVLPVLILIEGWAPTPMRPVPAVPEAVSRASGPFLVLPSSADGDARVMLWSAQQGFAAVGNGVAAMPVAQVLATRAAVRGFPDLASVKYLREKGFRSVVVLGTPAELALRAATATGLLGLTRTDLSDGTLYTLAPAA